jgi:hypothetical protein
MAAARRKASPACAYISDCAYIRDKPKMAAIPSIFNA